MSYPIESLEAGEVLGRYDLIMADPPWSFRAWSDRGYDKSAQRHYNCMSYEEIAALPIRKHAAKDCLLWLWATWPLLESALQIMECWGFDYKTGGAWHKKTKNGKTQFGTGHRLRSACEPFVVGTIGNPKTTRHVRNLVEGLVREHSRKPQEAYEACNQLMPDARKLDLFAREYHPGWDAWGDESSYFDYDVGDELAKKLAKYPVERRRLTDVRRRPTCSRNNEFLDRGNGGNDEPRGRLPEGTSGQLCC